MMYTKGAAYPSPFRTCEASFLVRDGHRCECGKSYVFGPTALKEAQRDVDCRDQTTERVLCNIIWGERVPMNVLVWRQALAIGGFLQVLVLLSSSLTGVRQPLTQTFPAEALC